MGYKLKILSPVHIGCGEQFNGLNFILDGNKVYVVEPETIIELLGPENGLRFAQWLDINSSEIARLDQDHRNKKRENPRSDETRKLNNDLRQKRQSFTLTTFAEKEKLITLEQLKSKAAYFIPFQDRVYKDSEIAPFVKQACSPYIPGTEIKGAIRTGVLYCAVKDDGNIRNWIQESFNKMLYEAAEKKQGRIIATYMDFIQAVKNQKKPDTRKKNKLLEQVKKIESQLQDRILNCNYEKPDAKYDVMKFLQAGDTNLLSAGSSLMVSFAEPFNMSNKFKIYYEYLRPETLISLTSFKLEDDISRIRKLKEMGFTERHKQLISGLNPILSCCQRFSADLLEEEIAYYTKHGKKDIVEHLRKIQKLNTAQAPVLRIGKDEGYTSLTVGLAVKKLMPDLYENVLIHATKNKSYDSSITGDNFYFPKSRKLVHWDGKELTAGWVQLIPDEIQQPTVKSQQEKNELIHKKPGTPVDFSGLSDRFGRKKL
jgi:CRISPR-associated protein Csm5